MSRIVRFHKTGGLQVLEIETVDLGAPGPGEVKIRVHALGLNRAVAMFRSGAYLEAPSFPARIGYGALVDLATIRPGDAVIIPAPSSRRRPGCHLDRQPPGRHPHRGDPDEQIVEAHRYLESNQQFGKIIVTVSS